MRQILKAALCAWWCTTAALGQKPMEKEFSELVGRVPIRAVERSSVLQVPYITWGGDVAAFYANGGLQTKPGSIFEKSGLKLNFTAGDNFVQQVRDYRAGKSPFLRCTMRMLGQASDVIGADPRTKPVVVAQLSWSQGDHIVANQTIKTLDQLRGKRIACQQGGPHVGLLYDSLKSVTLDKSDVQIVWVENITGPGSAAEAFANGKADACCVITPDMIALVGGGNKGTGAEGTVKGAFVLNSTQQMSGSIADIYAVRSDWFKANRDTVEKFTAGFLRGTEEVRTLRDEYEKSGQALNRIPKYKRTLQYALDAFGAETISSLEIEGHGLLLDCEFARLTGQIEFFEGIYDASGRKRSNPIGFEAKTDAALLMAKNWGYARQIHRFKQANWDYESVARQARLNYIKPKTTAEGPAKAGKENPPIPDDGKTIYSFNILFAEEQDTFPIEKYEKEFQRAIDDAALYKSGIIVVQGHSDTGGTLTALLKAGMKKGIAERKGGKWMIEGRPLKAARMTELIRTGKFSGAGIEAAEDPQNVMQRALTLSLERATEVKRVIVKMAAERGIGLDPSRLRPDGAGVSDPMVAVPRNPEQSQANRRVQFRVLRVVAERVDANDYDLLKGLE